MSSVHTHVQSADLTLAHAPRVCSDSNRQSVSARGSSSSSWGRSERERGRREGREEMEREGKRGKGGGEREGKRGGREEREREGKKGKGGGERAVSYTHLTLPTRR